MKRTKSWDNFNNISITTTTTTTTTSISATIEEPKKEIENEWEKWKEENMNELQIVFKEVNECREKRIKEKAEKLRMKKQKEERERIEQVKKKILSGECIDFSSFYFEMAELYYLKISKGFI